VIISKTAFNEPLDSLGNRTLRGSPLPDKAIL
jgi:hypothetical protein